MEGHTGSCARSKGGEGEDGEGEGLRVNRRLVRTRHSAAPEMGYWLGTSALATSLLKKLLDLQELPLCVFLGPHAFHGWRDQNLFVRRCIHLRDWTRPLRPPNLGLHWSVDKPKQLTLKNQNLHIQLKP